MEGHHNQKRKWNVVFEQYVIPPYRVPFFEQLSKEVNLTVVASTNRNIDGVADVVDNLPFRVLRFPENSDGSWFHKEIFNVMQECKADAFISFSSVLNGVLWKPELWKKMQESGVKIFWMGCDGFDVRNFWLERLLRFKPWHPKGIYRALRFSTAIRRTNGFICYSTYTAKYFHNVHNVSEDKIFIAQNF